MRHFFVLGLILSTESSLQKAKDLWPQCEADTCGGQICPDCSLIDCHPKFEANDCPEDSVYIDDIIWGCCPACVKYLDQGDQCAMTTANLYAMTEELSCSSPVLRIMRSSLFSNDEDLPTFRLFDCNPGNDCLDTGTCGPKKKNEKETYKCAYDKGEYDKWVEDQGSNNMCDHFEWSKECTPEGQYKRVQAKINTFTVQTNIMQFCTDPQGNRIFGSGPLDDEDSDMIHMNCKCSRKSWQHDQTVTSSGDLKLE
jgi:hypothetical protein